MAIQNIRPTYPNIIMNPQQDLQPQTKSTGCGRRFSKAMVRKIASQEAKKKYLCPQSRCPACNKIYAMSFMIFAVDTSTFLAQPTFYCRDCAHKNQSRYQRI